jgi:hypothetical protein
MNLRKCYSFENRRKLFEIHSSFKFATVVAEAGEPTHEFSCAFYLHNDEWLFGDQTNREPLGYQMDFVKRTGGDYLSLLELRSGEDLKVAETCFGEGRTFADVGEELGIRLSQELNMTYDSRRFTPAAEALLDWEDSRDPQAASRLLDEGYFSLHEGKTFRQYDDHWATRPRYLVGVNQLKDKPDILRCARYFRAAYREIAGPGDENVSIWCVLPSHCVNGHKAPVERAPWDRPNSKMLTLVGVANSFAFDWLLSLRVRASVCGFMRDSTPAPDHTARAVVDLSHGVLRLTCNHSGYAPLWKEQLGDAWRESGKPPLTWPVLEGEDERWAVRAAVDAVVADAYGLSRDQYAHVLSTFKHTSYPKAPELCLARFDELKSIGLDAFTKKHDPYWDIPLNENLPQPVIELPGLSQAAEEDRFKLGESGGKPKRKGRARK